MASSRSPKGLIIVLVILIAGGGGGYYWWSHRDKGPEFYTTPVDRGEIVQNVTASGVIKPLVDVIVSSQISGYITAWYTDFNAKVKKGDLLATLLPTSYQAAVKSAEGDLANAKANYDLQKVTLERDKELLTKSLIAQSDYDTQNAQVEEAAAQIQIKQATLDTARTNLSYCQIKSPIDGMVISRTIDVGNSVAATLSSPTLFEIGNDLTQMQIDASVAEADVGSVEDGQQVNFTVDAYPNRQFHGTVYQVRNAPQTQQNVVIYDVMIKVANDDLKLKPGMTALVSIIITRQPSVLRVANSALRFRPPEGTAFVAYRAPGAAPAASGSATASLSPQERRAAMREIFQQAGFNPRAGAPPTPEVKQKLLDLAKAKGIELPEAMLSGGGFGGGGGRNRQGGEEAQVYRNIYRLPANAGPDAKPEEIRVRLGITDGANTEITGDVKEGDVIITGLVQPSASPAERGGASPFGGGGGGRRFGG
ncbi:MAG TPA: efflux RND transporter periplasmic adaptor subunit [Opitutaceae bacterium]|nr:efflux RND transporter periplasmic adaptor subunit [Opitutaceae bacterium]